EPLVLETLGAGTQQAISQGLIQAPIETVEGRFSSTKLLQPNAKLNNYLVRAAEESGLTQISISERNGFNVAFSEPTEDFVQRDEPWWQTAKEQAFDIRAAEIDKDSGKRSISIAESITKPGSQEFMGVIKADLQIDEITQKLEATAYVEEQLLKTKLVQLFDAQTGELLTSTSASGDGEQRALVGGDTTAAVGQYLLEIGSNGQELVPEQVVKDVTAKFDNLKNVSFKVSRDGFPLLTFDYQGNIKSMTTVPRTSWIAVGSEDLKEIKEVAGELDFVFLAVTVIAGVISTAMVLVVSRRLSRPLSSLSDVATEVSDGNFDITAPEVGTFETRTLGSSFNSLVSNVKELLQKQVQSAEEQRQQRQELEQGVNRLMEEVEPAVDGDLTIRAGLQEGDVGIVADLFNAIIENLQDTAQQVTQSVSKVNSSLTTNQQAVLALSDNAIAEVEEVNNTLEYVEQMNESVELVSTNAERTALIADAAFTSAQQGNQAMTETVKSVLDLRTTVGETAKKMKQLGESAQKISQVVALIDEISLKTNLLAINASVEATRAGELGQGFTAVAEQVGSLATQSASAAKEIAQIVADIQLETQEVGQAMEQGTSQVVQSTRQVEASQERLADVLARSQEISTLMKSISNSTVTQSETAKIVNKLMQQIAETSNERAVTSREVADAIEGTTQVAQNLQTSVAQFKVD
ncbi:MAG: methyl-accepting chemotaxis protein, partial [Cyanobacteria bacterium P01_H01_bin.15]